MKAVRPVITSNGVPYLQMRLVGLHSMSEREKEGKKERPRGFCVLLVIFVFYTIYSSRNQTLNF